jgi:hypothetical protein
MEARREQRPEERKCVARACCRPRRLLNPPQADHWTGVIDVSARHSERKVTIPDACFHLHAAPSRRIDLQDRHRGLE